MRREIESALLDAVSCFCEFFAGFDADLLAASAMVSARELAVGCSTLRELLCEFVLVSLRRSCDNDLSNLGTEGEFCSRFTI